MKDLLREGAIEVTSTTTFEELCSRLEQAEAKARGDAMEEGQAKEDGAKEDGAGKDESKLAKVDADLK